MCDRTAPNRHFEVIFHASGLEFCRQKQSIHAIWQSNHAACLPKRKTRQHERMFFEFWLFLTSFRFPNFGNFCIFRWSAENAMSMGRHAWGKKCTGEGNAKAICAGPSPRGHGGRVFLSRNSLQGDFAEGKWRPNAQFDGVEAW